MVFKEGKVLIGTRKGSHGAGQSALPGGRMEYGETPIEGAMREVLEETGLKIKNVRLLCVHDLKAYHPKHYLDIGFVADWKSGKPKVTEPDKCEKWEWFDPREIPEPQFATMKNYVRCYYDKNHKLHDFYYYEV